MDRAAQERIAFRYRELTEHFDHWEKTKPATGATMSPNPKNAC